MIQAIRRTSLREEVRRAVLEMILRGQFAPDGRILENELALRLGVSRTPLREALVELAGEGLVVAHPGRGFEVQPLRVEEAAELYQVMALLEGAALREAVPLAPAVRDELQELNAAYVENDRGVDPEVAIDQDARWHEKLVSGCGNRTLLNLAARTRRQLLRYEHAFRRAKPRGTTSPEEHAEILALLEDGSHAKARRHLERHWLAGIEPVTAWIESTRRDP